MRRIIAVLSVMAIMAAIATAMAMPAFAGPFFPGTNSFAPTFAGTGNNFGNCQSQTAKAPGSADSAQDLNPAIFTKGQTSGIGVACSR